ncbi:butanediol dehydrogenase [Pseudonocardiaceae bacterium YIM PH 21723]|nr:butanediol dehydrogenase [Pseudonocardiaceae bacterium YIM PH 21723]
MRAALWHGPRDVRVQNWTPPPPGPGEVTVAVAYCGLCGSDLHEYADGPLSIPVHTPHPASGVRAPLVLGHEFSGTIVQVGPDTEDLAVGDRVAVEPNYRCGDCPACRRGEYNICEQFGFAGLMGHGGLAEETTVPGYMLHRLPEDMSLLQAALFEPAAVALHALRRGGLRKGETVLVLGLGPIGLFVVQLAARLGAARVIGVDPLLRRQEMALRLGASEVGAAALKWRVDLAVEAAGSSAAMNGCLAATRSGGRVVLVGITRQLRLDGAGLVDNEQTIIASVGYRNCFPELIRMSGEGLDLTPVVTSVIGLEQVSRALLGSDEQIKVLVRPKGGMG